jgi:hypothetical protein
MGFPQKTGVGDPNRWMLAGDGSKPHTKLYQVPAGQENVAVRRVMMAGPAGCQTPRVAFSNRVMTENGGVPVEVAVPSVRDIRLAVARFRRAYYPITWERMRDRPGFTVSLDGRSIVCDPGLEPIADPLPYNMLPWEFHHIETWEVSAIGDYRAGGLFVLGYRGESIELSASSLAGKIGNNSVLSNNVGSGSGGFTPGPLCMFGKGWDGRPVGILHGHSFVRNVGVIAEAASLWGGHTGYDHVFAKAGIPVWNKSVSGFALSTLAGAGGGAETGLTAMKALFDLLENPGGLDPFTFFFLPGDINGKTLDLDAWQTGNRSAWQTVRNLFPRALLVQESMAPYVASLDSTYGLTDQAHQTTSSNTSPLIWQSGGTRPQMNAWYPTQAGVEGGFDKYMDNRNIFSEDPESLLMRNDTTGASSPKMADATLVAASIAGAGSILITTTQPPVIGSMLLVGVGVANPDQLNVRNVLKRPDLGANIYQVFQVGGNPFLTGSLTFAHPINAVVKEVPSFDFIHYSGNQQNYYGDAMAPQINAGLVGAPPALITRYRTDTQDYFDRLPSVGSLSLDNRGGLDELFLGLEMCGGAEHMDLLYELSWNNAAQCAVNLRSASYTLTQVGAVNYANGVQGDGISAYLNTNYDPTVGTGKLYTLADSMMGTFCVSHASEDKSAMGNSANGIDCRRASGSVGVEQNGTGVAGTLGSTSNPTSFGSNIGYRVNGTQVGCYKNMVQGLGSQAVAGALVAAPLRILNGASGFCTTRHAFAFAGNTMTGEIVTGVHRALYRYLRRKLVI